MCVKQQPISVDSGSNCMLFPLILIKAIINNDEITVRQLSDLVNGVIAQIYTADMN